MALSHCGRDAPGLDVVPKRLDRIVETGTDGATFDWTVGPGAVERVSIDSPACRPIFEPGDLLLFDDFFLRRTAIDPTIDQTFDRVTPSECREPAEPVQRRLEKGGSLVIRDGPARVVNLTEGPGPPIGLTFAPLLGPTLVALTGPLTVRLEPADPSLSVKLCS